MSSNKQSYKLKGLSAIVLAAGMGKRMRSKKAKVLHPVAGRPMILYMMDIATNLADCGVVVVVGHQGEQVESLLKEQFPQGQGRALVQTVQQGQLLGTGHAVLQTKHLMTQGLAQSSDTVLIVNGDTPLLTEATIQKMWRVHQEQRATVTVLSAHVETPRGYGRIVRQGAQEGAVVSTDAAVLRIVEDRDASEWEAAITEINVGTYLVDSLFLFEALEQIHPENAQQEYYLTDLIDIAVKQGLLVSAVPLDDAGDGLGVNSRQQLMEAEHLLQQRITSQWMEAGVTILDPSSVWIGSDVRIGRDTTIYPNVALEGHTTIGEDCILRSSVRLTDCSLGDRVLVQDQCIGIEAELGPDTVVGPFAHLRPGAVLRRKAKVGNFVEMKKAELGEGSKANHLSYLGNATIGKQVNIGAGTITCNYDGVHKYDTEIGDQVFIGSNTLLIAPSRVGQGALIAAGSIVTEAVPADALAIARSQQNNLVGWAARRRALLEDSKGSSGRGERKAATRSQATSVKARPKKKK